MLKNILNNFIKNQSFCEIEDCLNSVFPNIINQMLLTPQNPIYHAEGDVWTHTKMTVLELINLQDFKKLNDNNQFITFWAMILHDIAKPRTTKIFNNEITAKGHSNIGAIMAKKFLYLNNVDYYISQEISNIISYHQYPFYILEKNNYDFLIKKISWITNFNNLLIVAQADMLGRICSDKNKHLENINILKEVQKEIDLSYSDTFTRFKYLQNPENINPTYKIFNDNQSNVFMMCGLPGSGKDTYITNNLSNIKMISLDILRQENPKKNIGEIINIAKDKSKIYLRKNEDFVFNATNLNKDIREKWINLFLKYKVNLNIIYLEKEYNKLLIDDKSRKDKSVGKKVINNMIDYMILPHEIDCHNFAFLNTTNLKKNIRKI